MTKKKFKLTESIDISYESTAQLLFLRSVIRDAYTNQRNEHHVGCYNIYEDMYSRIENEIKRITK